MIYAVAALFLNAASRQGVRGLLSTCCCNVFLALFLLAMWDGFALPAAPLPRWPIVLLGFTFVLGQWLTIVSLSLGEVSVVTPVLGIKVILVNIILAVGLREALSLEIWIGGVLSVLGVAALQFHRAPKTHAPRAGLACICAFLAALAFAGADVLIQHWSPILSFGHFIPPAMALSALISVILVMASPAARVLQHRRSLKALLPGGVLLALQSLLLILTLGHFGRAAEANIIYSSRGVWSVLFVWVIGHLFANVELAGRDRGRLIARFAGALMISAAIILAVTASD